MKRILWFYNRLLNRYKYPVQIISGGALWFVGDTISQRISYKHTNESNSQDTIKTEGKDSFSLDWRRAGRMTLYGMVISAPAYTFWYAFLDRWTHRIFSGRQSTFFTWIERSSHPWAVAWKNGDPSRSPSLGSSKISRLDWLTSLATQWRTWKIIGFKLFADTVIFDPIYLTVFFAATNLMEKRSFAEIKDKLKDEFITTYLIDIGVWFPIQTLNFKFVPVLYQPLVVQSCNIGWNAYLSFVQHRSHQ